MATQKSNKPATGKKEGRPAMFDSPEDMQELIDDYFASLQGTQAKPTISGLIYHLGFESRQSFYDYENKKEFAYTIKRARLRIEMIYEANLQTTAATGSIFALKNFGWSDRLELTGKDGNDIAINLVFKDFKNDKS